MKRSVALILLLAVVAPSAVVGAGAPDPLINLHHEIAGPAWKTWSLRLEANGEIIEKRTDWSSKNYHSEQSRCSLTKVESERAVEASLQLLGSLPSTVDSGRPIELDGPFKLLVVRHGGKVHSSRWYSPEDSNLSVEASNFVLAWEKLQALLTCGSE